MWLANTYLHIITDFLIYLLPMPVIFCLRFPRRQKVLLFVLFAFGFLQVWPRRPAPSLVVPDDFVGYLTNYETASQCLHGFYNTPRLHSENN